jgi:hypothetical protein
MNVSNEEARFHWAEGNRFAHEGIKSLLYINIGTAIAVIGFKGWDCRSMSFGVNILIFAFGAACAIGAFITAYVTNLCPGNGYSLKSEMPFASGKPWHRATYLLAGASLILFSIGAIMLWSEIG